jgi:hypothetical protein
MSEQAIFCSQMELCGWRDRQIDFISTDGLSFFQMGKFKRVHIISAYFTAAGFWLTYLALNRRVDTEQAVRIFRVNRNAMIIIDSDKASGDTKLNETKMRIQKEITNLGGFVWVTAGREVENYIPNAVLRRRYPDLNSDISQFEDVGTFLEQFKEGEGRKFEKKKVLFAETILPFIQRGDLKEALDLENQVRASVGFISRWNALDRG